MKNIVCSLRIAGLLAFTLVSYSCFADTLSPVTLAELTGVWKTSCLSVGKNSEVSQLSFSARGELTDQAILFADAQCGSPFYTAISIFDFSLNADQLSATATPFDATLQFNSLEAVVAANNPPGACGLTNWQLNVAQTIIGKACSSRDTVNSKIGRVSPQSIRVSVCSPDGTACQSADYVKQ